MDDLGILISNSLQQPHVIKQKIRFRQQAQTWAQQHPIISMEHIPAKKYATIFHDPIKTTITPTPRTAKLGIKRTRERAIFRVMS